MAGADVVRGSPIVRASALTRQAIPTIVARCGAFCETGECLRSVCYCGEVPCGGCEAGTVCDGDCVDTTSDPNHCGGCGTVCESGDCFDSWCYCGMVPCGCADGEICHGACVDTTTDSTNCGGCGYVCEFGECADSMVSVHGGIYLLCRAIASTRPSMPTTVAVATTIVPVASAPTALVRVRLSRRSVPTSAALTSRPTSPTAEAVTPPADSAPVLREHASATRD